MLQNKYDKDVTGKHEEYSLTHAHLSLCRESTGCKQAALLVQRIAWDATICLHMQAYFFFFFFRRQTAATANLSFNQCLYTLNNQK